MPPSPPPPPEQGHKRPKRALWKRWWFWVAAAVIALLIVAGITGGGSKQNAASTSPPASSPAAATSTPASPPVVPVVVPELTGHKVGGAKGALQDAGLVAAVTRVYSAKVAGTVLTVSPPSGTSVDAGSTVTLVVAKPLPAIPSVVGFNLTRARNALKARGFKVQVKQQVSSQPKGTVIAESPAGGTRARPGKVVTLTVAKAPPPPPPPPSNCTPGYSPCLIYHGGADYDCYGGSGNGPYYTAPGVVYRVTGYDPYGLDADHNGWGCQ
jgi:resuscitation-promoting factor RpfB